MPRKVDPRWGEDGFGDIEPVCLKDDQARELAAILGFSPDSPKVADIRFAVDDIGTTFRNWRKRGASAFTRAEARKALEEILRTKNIDYAALTSLNERAFQCVHDTLLMMKPAPVGSGDTVIVALTEDRLDEEVLRTAVLRGIKRLKAVKGPEREGDLAWPVAELCRLYEEVTTRKATHSSKGEHMAYQQEPQSDAGQFVRMCFRQIDDRVSHTQISRALRFFIESRNKA